MPRFRLRFVLALALLAAAARGAAAQEHPTALLAGYGGIDHEASLGPAYHLNLRHRLLRWDSVPLSEPGPKQSLLPGVEIQAEGFAQLGQSGTKVSPCESPEGGLCTRSADPLLLLGVGVVSHVDVTSARRPVQLYLLPATLALYFRSYEEHERTIGSAGATDRAERRIAGGFGNGIGLRFVVGDLRARLELRAVLVRDLDGGRGGSLPVSVGVEW